MPAPAESFYETSKAISEYLFFHYAENDRFLLNGFGPREALDFPKRCAALALRHPTEKGRALDLGCAVGRSTCELSAHFEETIGIDFSHGLIAAAQHLVAGDSMQGEIATEGDLSEIVPLKLPQNTRPDRLAFQQGDAGNLPSSLGTFDFVLMANLIDRLPNPRKCLETIHNFLVPGGVLAITSPYTWLEEYTPKENWLGGFLRDEQPVRTADTLAEILSPNFSLLESLDMPFLIRETSRKNQYTIAHATLWRRR